ncbi:VOC family protein [Knoellia sp. 3-2P3]|uniref:VOC family protein n=1 Tax=unclassified Knoellia TaxID=2618719 RepID=UPI0023DC40F7|nr:VOC family protein [Knoellia sp. 3-2P3]MDF2091507.1 VOC family protein [Knoellia sp. 3-2P3]
MGQAPSPDGVRQLRLTVHAEDYEQAVAFYRDTLGLPVELRVESEGGAEVMILDAGRATLELCNTAQVELIDQLEVGRRVSPKFRLALEVTDAAGTTTRAVESGAELVAEPTLTPWNSLNSRLETPGGIQLTLFEELGG